MIDPSIITRGAERAQMQQQQNFESLGELGNSLGRMVLGRRINTLQQLGTPEEKQAYANKPIYAPQLNAQIKADKAAELQAQMVRQKHASDIGKTDSETAKNTKQSEGFALDNSGKQLGAIQSAIQSAAMTGSKDAAVISLESASRVGLISPEEYQSQKALLDGMTPDQVKMYAQSVVFGNSKDPASLLFTTANNRNDNKTSIQNNELTNKTSAANNERTVGASIYSTDVGAKTADKNREQDSQQFEQKITLEQAELEYKQGKGEAVQFGDSMYMTYPDGRAIPISGPTGQPITKTNSTIKTSIAEEDQRTQKVSVTLSAIEKLLDDATGSGVGRLVDGTARVFGIATKGDVATAKLGTLGGQLVALMPKMSGPQSDKDVEMYKQMAGKLDDPSIPVEIRKAALGTIRELNDKYSELNKARGQGVPYANAGAQTGSGQGELSGAQSQGFQSLISKYTVD